MTRRTPYALSTIRREAPDLAARVERGVLTHGEADAVFRHRRRTRAQAAEKERRREAEEAAAEEARVAREARERDYHWQAVVVATVSPRRADLVLMGALTLPQAWEEVLAMLRLLDADTAARLAAKEVTWDEVADHFADRRDALLREVVAAQ
jgi:hypothetical protein